MKYLRVSIMKWIKAKHEHMRGDIETRQAFIRRNLRWWVDNRRFERVRRKSYYRKFLNFANVRKHITEDTILAEVGPGPLGGMIEVMKLPAKQKIFIDYIMEDLFHLNLIYWPQDAIYVDAAAESIPLKNDSADVLISYNTIDHGWDVYTCILECVRVGRTSFIAFDCRGDDNGEVDVRKDGRDKDHHQLLKYNDICAFMDCNFSMSGYKWSIKNMNIKHFPVAYITVEK